MALKDRLEARRRPEAGHPVPADTTLSVLAGAREESKAATPAVREEAVPKSGGGGDQLAGGKGRHHAQHSGRAAPGVGNTPPDGGGAPTPAPGGGALQTRGASVA